MDPCDALQPPFFADGNATKLEPPAQAIIENRALTTGVAIGDVDNDGDLDTVTSGNNFSPRYYKNDGLGNFSYQDNFLEGLSEDDEICHYVLLDDVDGDGDPDLVVSHKNVHPSLPAEPNRIWFNDDPASVRPFVKSQQPDLQWAGLAAISWVPAPGATCATAGQTYLAAQTFEPVLADLDQDNDLDLLISSYTGNGAAYLNNGCGYFGTSNVSGSPDCSSPALNDGCAAFEFPVVTPDWTGSSECIYNFVMGLMYTELFPPLPDPFNGCPWNEFIFTVPGAILNASRGVAVADMNGDGYPEVAFSNANVLEEQCSPLPYLSATGPSVPGVFDYLHTNQTLAPGQLNFSACVEIIELANDGTAYGEFVRFDRDNRPDWLDANFNNFLPPPGEPPGPWNGNFVYWGNSLTTLGCDVGQEQAAPGGPGGGQTVSLHFTANFDWSGYPYLVLASASGTEPAMLYAGAEVPLKPDALTDLFLGAVGGAYPGSIGLLNDKAEAWMDIKLPQGTSLVSDNVWFAVVVMAGDSAVQVSNAVAVDI